MNTRGYIPVGGIYPPNAVHQNHIRSVPNNMARRKQINTLKIFNDNVTEIRQEQEYRIFFSSDSGDRLVMVIFLPETFPLNTRPVIKIFFSGHGGDDHQNNVDFDTKVTHPWLDINSSSVIGSPGLNTFGVHSELGRVVQAIKREFEKNPPRKMFMAELEANINGDRNISKQMSSSVFCSKNNGVIGETTSSSVALNNSKMPTCNSVMIYQKKHQFSKEVNELNKKDLQELLEEPVVFKHFYKKLDISELKSMDETANGLNESIKECLATNHELSDQLHEKKNRNISKASDLEAIQAKCSQTAKILRDTTSGSLTRSAICDKLNIASHKDEQESEKFAEEFLSGNLSLDDFLTSYVSARKNYHLCKTKGEKFGPI